MMIRILMSLILFSAIYGFTVGSAHCWLYAQRNLIKFPLLLLFTSFACTLSYYIIAQFLMVKLSLKKVVNLTFHLINDLSLLLASLSTANFFIAMILVSTDDSRKGEYSLFLGMNVIFVGVSGSLALIRQGSSILKTLRITRKKTALVILSWLMVSLMVGGQAAFYLRPFFGLPASRGCKPPFALGAEPDVRGAKNFYEAMVQIFENPPLPKSWGGSGD